MQQGGGGVLAGMHDHHGELTCSLETCHNFELAKTIVDEVGA